MPPKFAPKIKNVSSIKNAILHLTEERNRSSLTKIILESLDSIRTHFYAGSTTPELEELRHACTHAPCAELNFIFFALVNVDVIIKENLFKMEVVSHRDKLSRFFMDLRPMFVAFLVNTEASPHEFVAKCEETYLLS